MRGAPGSGKRALIQDLIRRSDFTGAVVGSKIDVSDLAKGKTPIILTGFFYA